MAAAQHTMSQTIESTISASLEAFAATELKTVSILSGDADELSDSAEQLFAKYLNGSKNFAESFTGAGSSGDSSKKVGDRLAKMKAKGWGNRLERIRSVGKLSEPSSSSDKDDALTAALQAANLHSSLEKVRLVQATAELKRFQLMKHLISVQHRRNFELGEHAMLSVHTLNDYHRKCMRAVESALPKMNKIQSHQEVLRQEHATKIVPQWQEREVATVETVNSIQRKAVEAGRAVDAIITNPTGAPVDRILTTTEIEEQTQLWNLPQVLAASAQYQRDSMPGVLMEGWLYKKSSAMISLNPWTRRWFVMDHNSIYYYRNDGEMRRSGSGMERVKVCDVVLCTVRELPEDKAGTRFCFQLVTPSEKPLTLQARGPEEYRVWVDGIRSTMENRLVHGDPHSEELNKNIGRQRKNSGDGSNGRRTPSFPQLPPAEFRDASQHEESETDSPIGQKSKPKQSPVVQKLMVANPTCADCGMEQPDWASLNLGVLICIECSAVHRSLGVHVSKVRSLMLDSLSKEEGSLLLSLGNEKVNPIWEDGLSTQEGWTKPTKTADRKTREDWIKSKYMWKGFLNFEGCDGLTEEERGEKFSRELYEAAKDCDVQAAASALAHGGSVDWTHPDEGGKTALHVCAMAKQSDDKTGWNAIEMAEFLLQNGAKMDTLDASSHGVLDCALLHGAAIDMVEYLTSKLS